MLFIKNDKHIKEMKIAGGAAGISIYLALLEYLFPKPFPFLKFGFSNIPSVILAGVISFKAFMLLTLIKVIGTIIWTGTIFSPIALISIIGSFTSAFVMYGAKKFLKDKISFLGVSVAGAFVSDIFRLLTASLILFSKEIFYLFPFIMIFGIISSIFIGQISFLFSRNNNFFQLNFIPKGGSELESQIMGQSKENIGIFVFTFFIAIFFTVQPILSVKFVMFIILIALFFILKRKFKPGITILVFFTIIFLNLLAPSGKILFQYWKFIISLDSLLAGLDKALTFCGLILISILFMKNSIAIPGKRGSVFSYSFQCLLHLTQIKIPIKEIFRYNYIYDLNSISELEINKQVIKKNLNTTYIVFLIFLSIFILSIVWLVFDYFVLI